MRVRATSVTWLFPGETVRVDASCLDCGDPVTVEMRDGHIFNAGAAGECKVRTVTVDIKPGSFPRR